MSLKKRGEQGKGHSPALMGVRNLLLEGSVSQGFHLLDEIWRSSLPRQLDELISFSRSTLDLAAIYHWNEAGLGWLQKAEAYSRSIPSSGKDRSCAEVLFQALRARFSFANMDREPARAFFGKFTVGLLERELPSLPIWEPWSLNFYTALLIEEHRLEEVDSLYQSPPIPNRSFSCLDSAVRLRLLGHRFAYDGKNKTALNLFRAAERKLVQTVGPEAEYHRANCIAGRSRALSDLGLIWEAEECLALAERIGVNLRMSRVLDTVQLVRAHIQKHRGLHVRAVETLLGTSLQLGADDPAGNEEDEGSKTAVMKALVCINAARHAVEAGRLSVAERLLSTADPLVARSNVHRILAFYHFVQGEVERKRNSPESRYQAWRQFRCAEEILRSQGSGDRGLLLPLLLVGKGWLARSEGNVPESVRCAVESLDLARESKSVEAEAKALLLQSALLLDGRGAPRGRLYERILPRLGAIENPEDLLRVVANLYFYTWELPGAMDLTDLHMKQIHRIRHLMDEKRFQELYNTHVTMPLMELLRRQFKNDS